MQSDFTDGSYNSLYIANSDSFLNFSNESFDESYSLDSFNFPNPNINQSFTLFSDGNSSNDVSLSHSVNTDHSFSSSNSLTHSVDNFSLLESSYDPLFTSDTNGSLSPDTLEQHKPLFGVHPLLLPFEHEKNSASLVDDISIFNGFPDSEQQARDSHHVSSYAASTSTPSKSSEKPFIDEDNLVWTVLPNMKLVVQCQYCGEEINTGNPVKNMGPLIQHVAGRRCKSGRSKYLARQKAEIRAASNACSALFGQSSGNKENSNLSGKGNAASTPENAFKDTAPSRFENLHLDYTADSENEADKIPLSATKPALQSSRQFNMSTSSSISMQSSSSTCISSGSFDSSFSQSTDCPGIPLNWPLPHIFLTYPFPRHQNIGTRMNYGFCQMGMSAEDFWIRSVKCTGINSINGFACVECAKLPKTVAHLAFVAKHAAPGTNFNLLSSMQQQAITRGKEIQLSSMRLEILNLKRSCATLVARQEDSKRFLSAIAEYDVPRVDQLVKQCLKEKVSTKQIINRIEDSVAKLYRVKGYNQMDLDIAILCTCVGGSGLLYSMSKRFALPSKRTVDRSQRITQLLPSHGTPNAEEIGHNLNEVLQPYKDLLGPAFRSSSGICIFWDEINEEDAACYFPHSDSVGGLCREHSPGVDLRLKSFESAISIAKALSGNSVHYGKEASVIAIGSFGSTLVGALPIALSPTCKSETPEESATILERVIKVYSGIGAANFGPVWSFASDGDSGRRLMCHRLFVKLEVDREHILFKYVGRLQGLNLFIGENDITADIDWKHLIKRMARVTRTTEGLIVNNTLINREIILRHLRLNSELSDLKIHQLMNPADAQDVPRAFELLLAIRSIMSCIPEGCSPTVLHEINVLSTIGVMFVAFLDAFTCVDWNLSQQITALSTYAHMSFILFRRHRVNFMPNQLYIDSQTCVKNVIFCIAKQKNLDDTQPFHLFLTGDDRLENLFGRIRMQGGHNPNCTFKQLVDRAGAAVDINNVFARHPDWDKGHRRLKVTRTEHLDHLNKESWRGSATVSDIDLYDAWTAGQTAALSALSAIGIFEDLNEVFKLPRVDLMRPFGDGHYPGVADDSEPDRSTLNEPVQVEQLTTDFLSATLMSDSGGLETTLQDESEEQYEDTYALDDRELSAFTETHKITDDEHEESLNLDDIMELPNELQLPIPANLSGEKLSPFLDLGQGGKPIHKASICRVMINPGYGRKSHERVLRVRGYTAETKPYDLNSENLIGADTFLAGDLFAALIRCNSHVCLALLKCVVIEEKGSRTDQVDKRKLQFEESKVFLFGQILDMHHIPKISAESDRPEGSTTLLSTIQNSSESLPAQLKDHTWIWTGSYAQLDLNTRSKELKGKAARKTLIIKFASNLCEPVNLQLLDTGTFSSGALSNAPSITWEVGDDALDFVIEKIWQSVKDKNALNTIPQFKQNSSFPYKNANGDIALISEEGSLLLASQNTPQDNKLRCYQCLAYIERGQMRDHVGRHILKSIRHVHEDIAGDRVSGDDPCGFCGRSGLPACSQLYLTKGTSMQAKSGCIYFTKFRYQPALMSTVTTPCTNVPVICTLPHCSKDTQEGHSAIWKYNMLAHIRANHPGYNVDAACSDFAGYMQLPDDLINSIFISDEEEEKIKIPRDKIPLKLIPAPKDDTEVQARGRRKRKANTTGATNAGSSKRRR